MVPDNRAVPNKRLSPSPDRPKAKMARHPLPKREGGIVKSRIKYLWDAVENGLRPVVSSASLFFGCRLEAERLFSNTSAAQFYPGHRSNKCLLTRLDWTAKFACPLKIAHLRCASIQLNAIAIIRLRVAILRYPIPMNAYMYIS